MQHLQGVIGHLLVGAVGPAHSHQPGHFGHTEPPAFIVEGVALLHDHRLIVALQYHAHLAAELIWIGHVHDAHRADHDQAGLLRQNENRIGVKQDVANRAAGELEDGGHQVFAFDREGIAKLLQRIIRSLRVFRPDNPGYFLDRPQDAQQGRDIVNPHVETKPTPLPRGKREGPIENVAVARQRDTQGFQLYAYDDRGCADYFGGAATDCSIRIGLPGLKYD